MKRFLPLAFGLLFMVQGFSQSKDFNLSDYKLPDYKRQSLDFGFYLYSDNDYFKKVVSQIPSDEISENHFASSAYANYNLYINTPRSQRTLNTGLYLTSSANFEKQEKELLSKSFSLSPQFYLNAVNRIYKTPKQFYEIDFKLNTYNPITNYSYPQNTDYTKSNHHYNDYLIVLPLKLGYGRIEPVQDARLAVYIYDELLKQNSLAKEMTNEEIIKFAETISQIKNKRFLDSRLRRMVELETIHQFLDSNNYLTNADIKYYNTLLDLWEYGDRPNRNSGTRISASIRPGFYLKNSKSKYDDVLESDNSSNTLILNTGIEFKHEKPINLKWQNSIDIAGFVGTAKQKFKDSFYVPKQDIIVPNLQLEYIQKIGFYPNTRTDIEFSYSIKYFQLFDKTDVYQDISGIGNKQLLGKSDLSLNYYISPKFRININASMQYNWIASEDSSYLSGFNYYMLYVNPNNLQNVAFFDENTDQYSFSNSFRLRLFYSLF